MGLLIVFGACSSNDPSGSPGSGGNGATAGTGGSGGSSGSPNGGQAGSSSCECSVASITNCGHRGFGKKGDLPENTIESAVAAFQAGADMVEIDVLDTADRQMVLMHDDTIDRTTDGTGCAGDLTVAEIQAFDAAKGTPLEGTGVIAPTLGEFFAAVDGEVNVEVKSTGGGCPTTDRPAVAQLVVDAITADTKTRRVVISSFDIDLLREIRKIDATQELGLLSVSASSLDAADQAGFQALNLIFSSANAQAVMDVRARGMELNVWTANGPALKQMLDLGVDMIITDQPDQLATQIAERCAMECPGD